MFSFIKWLQQLLSALQKNKGIWFTTLTLASASGIFISMYLINTMTSTVAIKTYLEERRVDLAQLDNFQTNHYDQLLTIGSVLSIDKETLVYFKNVDRKSIEAKFDETIKSINSHIITSELKVKYYFSNRNFDVNGSENRQFAEMVMETDSPLSGMVVNKDGVRLVGFVPVVDDKNISLGVIEVSKSVHTIKDDFINMGKEFVFIIDKHQLVFLDLKHKTGTYQDIDDQYKVAFHNYDSNFYINAQNFEIKEMLRMKYKNDAKYFTTFEEITDLNGRIIGLALVGEDAKNANSFVKITQNMINSVTTVALGLVISLIMFMF